jgi:hypothetical protein
MPDLMIGVRAFGDGVEREVYLDSYGRQYVREDRCKVYGVWLLPAEPTPEAVVVVTVPPRAGTP